MLRAVLRSTGARVTLVLGANEIDATYCTQVVPAHSLNIVLFGLQ